MSFLRTAAITTLLCLFTSLNAAAPTYHVDKKYKVTLDENAVYLATLSDSSLVAVCKSGAVKILSSSGKEITSFKMNLTEGEQVRSVAVDGKNNIFVFITKYRALQRKIRGRTYKYYSPVEASFVKFDKKGKKLDCKQLKGIRSAVAAQFTGKELAVGDYTTSTIFFIDPDTAEIKANVHNGIRLCCGIFDFSKGLKPGTVVVANLGAFKVQTFNSSGTVSAWGKRGRDLSDFHGCCNPVSVAVLPNACIVTVEKDPTRIKVYDKKGKRAKVIKGVQELVKGCSHIPVAVDSKGNIYLASNKKQIIKCKK